MIQVRTADVVAVRNFFAADGLASCVYDIGAPTAALQLRFSGGGTSLALDWIEARRAWSETSHRMRLLRDDPDSAREEFAAQLDPTDPGLQLQLAFDPQSDIAAPYINRGARPAVAVLREQGVNSQVEMAAVLELAGFEAHDIHMSDLLSARRNLGEFRGLVACGGFSYGDVLGAGEGWAKSILFHDATRAQFARFFERGDTFTLGVCNGCQMMAALKQLVPGTEHWPRFVRNRGEQFEGRFSLVEILESPSVLLAGMAGSRIAHRRGAWRGPGRIRGPHPAAATDRGRSGGVSLCGQPWWCGHYLSSQSQRFAAGYCRGHQPRWPRAAHHAASRTILPFSAEFLVSARPWRIQRLDAHVPQRPRLGKLTRLQDQARRGNSG